MKKIDCKVTALALMPTMSAMLAISAFAAAETNCGSRLPFSVDSASGALAIVAGGERYETQAGLPAKGIRREGEALRWTVEPEPGNVVTARLSKVSAREFRLTLSAPAEMKMTRPVAYPPAWRTAKGDTCIWPFGEGMAYPADDPSIEMQAEELSFANGQSLSMGFYGFLRGGSCLMTGVAKTCDAGLAVKCGDGLWSATPKWNAELGRWAYDRELRFFLAPSLPVAASAYRAWRERRGEVKTFREKLGKNPALARFPGTADVWLWDDNTQCRLYNWPLKPNAPVRDSVKIAREMKALGLDRVLWNSFEGETRESCAALKELGYFVGTYDCLRDIFHPGLKAYADPKNFVMASRFLDCAEEIVRRNPDGSPATAWTIPDRAGKMHPMWSLCDAMGLEMVKRFVMPQIAVIGYDSRLMDVQVGNGPGVCHAKGHPCTRRSGLEALREEHRFLCEEGGQVVGVEVGQEALLDGYHYSEGLTCCPHPFRKELCWRYKDRALYGDEVPEKTKTYLHNPARRIPLWELVYHDCTVSYYYWADSTLMYPELAETKDLFCALYGLPPIYSMNVSTWNELKGKVAESYRRATPVARRTMFARMTDFDWLSPDRLLQRTTFANGVSVVANFSDEVRAGLAPRSWRISEPTNGQDARSPANAATGGAISSERFAGDWRDADQPRPPVEKPGWTLTFADDFDGVHLKDRNWYASYRAGRKDWFRRMGIPSRFQDPDANYVIEDGVLKLRIDRDVPLRPEPRAAAVSSIQTSDYRVGATTNEIQRLDKFAQKYGWWEIRCRMPKGDGLHAAFWLTHADPLLQEYTLDNRRRGDVCPKGTRGRESTVEIDIFEALGRYEKRLDVTVLFPDNASGNGHYYNHDELAFDWSRHFHVYALEWNEGELTWYVDGQKYWTYRGPTPQHEMMILLGMYQLGANPKFAGWLKPTPPDLPYPRDFEIDYVRVYRRTP